MTLSRSVLGLALLSFPLYEFHGTLLQAAQCQSTWTGAGTSDWNTAANWNPACIPGNAPANPNTDIATFSGSGSDFDPNISTSITIEKLQFSANGYALSTSPTTPQVLTFDGSSATISSTTGTNTILVPIVLNDELALNVSSGATINFETPCTVTSNPTSPTTNPGQIVVLGGGSVVSSCGSPPGFSPTLLTIDNGVTFTNNGLMGLSLTSNEDLSVSLFPGSQLINNGTLLDTLAGTSATFSMSSATFSNTGIFAQSTAGNINIQIDSGTVTNSGAFGSSSVTGIVISGGTVTNNASVNFGVGASQVTISGAATINNAGNFSDNSTLDLDNSGATFNNTGNIGTVANGPATIEMSSGTLNNELGGNIYSTNVGVGGGTLVNNGTITIPSGGVGLVGGVMQGTGTINFATSGAVNNVSGTLMPGNPGAQFTPGTLALTGTGNYDQQTDGTLSINVINASSHGEITCHNATLDGTLLITALPSFDAQIGDNITILSASNQLFGTFATVTEVGFPASINTQVQYNTATSPFTVSLLFIAGPTPPSPTPVVVTLSSYAGGFSETIFSSVNHIYSHLGREMARVRQHLGTQSSSNQTASRMGLRSDLLLADATNSFFAINPQTIQKQEEVKRELNTPQERKWNVYAGPLGTIGSVHAFRDSQAGFHYWSGGALAGFDYAFNQVGVGLLVNYERIEANVRHNWGKFTINEGHANLYFTYAPEKAPNLAVNTIVGGGYDHLFIRRNTGTSTAKEIAKGTTNIQEFDGLFGLEYTIGKTENAVQFIPLASLQYIYFNMDNYHEHNAGVYNLSFKSQRASSLRTTLGARLGYNYQSENFSFFPEVNAAWQREYFDHDRSIKYKPINVASIGTTSIDVVGAGRNFAEAGIDLMFTFYKSYGIELNYQYEWNSLIQDHFAYAGFNIRF